MLHFSTVLFRSGSLLGFGFSLQVTSSAPHHLALGPAVSLSLSLSLCVCVCVCVWVCVCVFVCVCVCMCVLKRHVQDQVTRDEKGSMDLVALFSALSALGQNDLRMSQGWESLVLIYLAPSEPPREGCAPPPPPIHPPPRLKPMNTPGKCQPAHLLGLYAQHPARVHLAKQTCVEEYCKKNTLLWTRAPVSFKTRMIPITLSSNHQLPIRCKS